MSSVVDTESRGVNETNKCCYAGQIVIKEEIIISDVEEPNTTATTNLPSSDERTDYFQDQHFTTSSLLRPAKRERNVESISNKNNNKRKANAGYCRRYREKLKLALFSNDQLKKARRAYESERKKEYRKRKKLLQQSTTDPLNAERCRNYRRCKKSLLNGVKQAVESNFQKILIVKPS